MIKCDVIGRGRGKSWQVFATFPLAIHSFENTVGCSPIVCSWLAFRSASSRHVAACRDDGERCIKNKGKKKWTGKERKEARGRTASRSRGGKEPPVKLSYAAIIAFRLVSSGSLRIPLSNVLRASFLFSRHLRPSSLVPRSFTVSLGLSRSYQPRFIAAPPRAFRTAERSFLAVKSEPL